MDKNTLLTVEDLKVHFPVRRGLLSRAKAYVHAVDGVSLWLDKGETLGIVGESGCGKTTAGMAVLNLVEATGGRIYYRGRDITRFEGMSREEILALRKNLQIIFQDPYSSLNPRMTLRQMLALPMQVHDLYPGKERKERIDYLLSKVGLTPEQGNRYPHEFSGGQRQRIGIARALAMDPEVIIGDEPVSALDVSIQAQIINLLMDLQDEFDLSYIIISHDLAVVEHVSDRIVVMYLGKVVESAAYADLYGTPLHPYTQALLSAVPPPDPRQQHECIKLEGDVPSPINPPSGCAFHPRCVHRMDVCTKVTPELLDMGGGHWAACHLL
jgi:oligopeptide/dipeptide ABC transporter ATP-binding protein